MPSRKTKRLLRRRVKKLTRMLRSNSRDPMYAGWIIKAREKFTDFRLDDINHYVNNKRSKKSTAFRFLLPVLFVSGVLAIPTISSLAIGTTFWVKAYLATTTLLGAFIINNTRNQLITEDVLGYLATDFAKVLAKEPGPEVEEFILSQMRGLEMEAIDALISINHRSAYHAIFA